MTATLNVNLSKCADWCRVRGKFIPGCDHSLGCPGAPVLVPCPIPRSVTCSVVLGPCNCDGSHAGIAPGRRVCTVDCASVPIKVLARIEGDTWESSEVDDVEMHGPEDFAHDGLRIVARDICRERWELVKALVLGERAISVPISIGPQPHLLSERDAVYAALADMARAEQDACNAQQRVDEAFPSARYAKPGDADHRAERPSANRLARYIKHLIEQVGGLS